MKLHSTILVTALVAGCAAGTSAVASDPTAQQNTEQEIARRAELEKKWEAIPTEMRKECDLKVGECSMDVKDKRHDLVRRRAFPGCHNPLDEAAQTKCEDDAMLGLGEGEAVLEYYTFANWCLQGLIDCAAKLEVEAAAEQKDAKIRERERTVEEAHRAYESAERMASAGPHRSLDAVADLSHTIG